MRVDTYCAGCGRPVVAPNRKTLVKGDYAVHWSKASQALFVLCPECRDKALPLVGDLMDQAFQAADPDGHPMRRRKLYRLVPLAPFVVANAKMRHVLYALDAVEAVELARKEGWFGETEPITVEEFVWLS